MYMYVNIIKHLLCLLALNCKMPQKRIHFPFCFVLVFFFLISYTYIPLHTNIFVFVYTQMYESEKL